MSSIRAMCSLSAQQSDYVKQHEDGNNHLQRKHAPFVELVHHELVKLSRGFQFFADEHPVVGNTNFRRANVVDASVIRIADEFDGVFSSLRQVHDVEADSI